MSDTTRIHDPEECPYCSGGGISVTHSGTCPRITAIEYHQNGTIKRVEFRDPRPNWDWDGSEPIVPLPISTESDKPHV